MNFEMFFIKCIIRKRAYIKQKEKNKKRMHVSTTPLDWVSWWSPGTLFLCQSTLGGDKAGRKWSILNVVYS